MAKFVIMPKMGFNMEVGHVAKWHFQEGDIIKKGDIIADIETDKTTIGYESQFSGVLLKILVKENDPVPVVEPIAIVGEQDEDISRMIEEAAKEKKTETPAEQTAKTAPSLAPQKPGTQNEARSKLSPRARKYLSDNGLDLPPGGIVGTGYQGGITQSDIEDYILSNKHRISPLAKKVAFEAGIDVSALEGSGVDGRIMRSDVESMIVRRPGESLTREIPYSGIRKIIGERLSQSKFTAPHLYFTVSVNMEKLMDFREQANQNNENKISLNDCILFFVTKALIRHPSINSSLQGDKILQYGYVNLGMAVASDEGLIVPVLKNVDMMPLGVLSKQAKALALKAKERRLMPDEYQGGTFTVSNLGMYGIENFTAIINPPEAGILSVSAVKYSPVAKENHKDSELALKPMMNMTLSVDHRLVDGVIATKFITEVRMLLENPILALL